MLTFVLVALMVAAGLYFFAKKTNDDVYFGGRAATATIDMFDFMQKPYKDLRSVTEKAIFHYLVQRPWRESDVWFQGLINMKATADAGEMSESERQYVEAMHRSMIGDLPLDIFARLVGFPPQIRSSASADYARWSKFHQAFVTSNPNASVGDFVAESSKAAARAYCAFSK